MNCPKDKENGGKFELRFHSGYKRDETPRSVIIGRKEFLIERIIWRKRVFDRKSGEQYEVFKCKMNGKVVKITKYQSGKWALSFTDET